MFNITMLLFFFNVQFNSQANINAANESILTSNYFSVENLIIETSKSSENKIKNLTVSKRTRLEDWYSPLPEPILEK